MAAVEKKKNFGEGDRNNRNPHWEVNFDFQEQRKLKLDSMELNLRKAMCFLGTQQLKTPAVYSLKYRVGLPTLNVASFSSIPFLLLFFIVVIKDWSKTNFRRKGFTWATCPDQSPSLREAKARAKGRNLEAGAEAEAMEECCLVACSLLAQPTS